MPSRSAPASPAPPRYTPREFIRNPIRGSPSPGTPLVSPLAPLPAGILNRNRKGSFGPEDPHPHLVKHRRGEEPVVRPGSLVSPQTIYTGRERRSNVTGEPGAINGHASVQLHAAPDNKRDWGLEVPYVSDFQIRNTLTKYGSGVHKEDETSENESEVSEGWRPSISPASAFPPVPETDEPTGSFPPSFRTLNVVPDNGEDGPDGSTLEDWLPADPAMWSSSRLPMTEPEEMGNDRIERVVRRPNFVAPIVDAPGSGAPDDTDVAHEEQEREEGEMMKVYSPSIALSVPGRPRACSCNRSGRRGALIGRDRYSSSPSVAATEFATEVSNSCAELLPVLRHSRPRSSWTAADFVAEAEELIDGVVNSVGSIPRTCSTSSPELVLAPPLPDPSIAHFTSPLASDPLFDLDDDSDNDSCPNSSTDSSDIASSSEENSAASGDFIFVRTTDCFAAMEKIRRSASTPERDPVARAEVLEGLAIAVSSTPSRSMDVLRSYLEDISIEKRCHAAEQGTQLSPEFFVETGSASFATTSWYDHPDGKRLRRLGGDALNHGEAFRTVIYAECRRLQDYLSPLIILRGYTKLFIAQAADLITRRHYPVDLDRLDLSLTLRCLSWDSEENTKLVMLHRVFAQQGQSVVATEIEALLRLRFRDSRLLARLLRSKRFPRRRLRPSRRVRMVEGEVAEAECSLQSASISTPVSTSAILSALCSLSLSEIIFRAAGEESRPS
ncbi:hypothetical protein B0H13DRAFT_2360443 [Mycena leptocephala]|nr:hypothetical protein B0H13DRAFT_2360443 [Mycena leptocephala]